MPVVALAKPPLNENPPSHEVGNSHRLSVVGTHWLMKNVHGVFKVVPCDEVVRDLHTHLLHLEGIHFAAHGSRKHGVEAIIHTDVNHSTVAASVGELCHETIDL